MYERIEITKTIEIMKVLNLYACLGGNRLKWTDCEVTAVELDPELARMYQERFPNDTVIVGDAHQYLLDHYKEFDFIWSSPPCPTHSRMRFSQSKNHNKENYKPVFPDMKLYEEIIFLDNYFKGKYCVENVIPYYEPLVPANKRGRHLYWTNFNLPNNVGGNVPSSAWDKIGLKRLMAYHKITDLMKDYNAAKRKDSMINNLVDYEAGLTIFNTARGIHEASQMNQTTIFEQGA